MSLDTELSSLRSQVAVMAERERRLMDLLNTSSAERIEHDIRNVLNELSLLRVLFDKMDCEETKPTA